MAYNDASDPQFYRVLVWDNLDFLHAGAWSPGENRVASPVTFNHGANPSARSAALTLLVGNGGTQGDRVTIGANADLVDSLDGSAGAGWDEPGPVAVTIPGGEGTTVVQLISEEPGLDFHTVAPCRVADTRAGTPLAPGETREVDLAGICGIAPDPAAAAVNVTAVAPAGSGQVLVYPAEGVDPAPLAAVTVETSDGLNRANNGTVMLPAAAAGAVRIHNALAGEVDVAVDAAGYFTPRGDDLLWIMAMIRVALPAP